MSAALSQMLLLMESFGTWSASNRSENDLIVALQATLGLLPVSANAAHLTEGLSTARAAVGLLLGVNSAVPL